MEILFLTHQVLVCLRKALNKLSLQEIKQTGFIKMRQDR